MLYTHHRWLHYARRQCEFPAPRAGVVHPHGGGGQVERLDGATPPPAGGDGACHGGVVLHPRRARSWAGSSSGAQLATAQRYIDGTPAVVLENQSSQVDAYSAAYRASVGVSTTSHGLVTTPVWEGATYMSNTNTTLKEGVAVALCSRHRPWRAGWVHEHDHPRRGLYRKERQKRARGTHPVPVVCRMQ